MKVGVARQVRLTNHLALIVDVQSDVAKALTRSPQAAQVDHCIFLPEQCVQGLKTLQNARIECRAWGGGSSNLSVVVDRECRSVAIPIEGNKLAGLAVCPGDRFELEH